MDAAYNLVQVCDRPGDRERFLKWLEVLTEKHADGQCDVAKWRKIG
ncbi:MAG: hypothetical protein FWB97_06305 [Oscillospiraceae bacterium]|nr:hypothetical protein [Oscillospiraceae bacterium]